MLGSSLGFSVTVGNPSHGSQALLEGSPEAWDTL